MLRQDLPRRAEDHLASRPAAHTPPMSAECETVGAQQLPPAATQPIVSTPPITTSGGSPKGHNPPSGISYEGRVSVIPPLAGYEATMRAAMDLEATSSAHHDDLDQHRLDLRRLYEQRAREDHERRMHENSLYYGFPKHLDMGQQQQQQSRMEDSAHQQESSGYQTMTPADPPKIKEEIQDEEPLEGFSQDHHLSQQQQQQQQEEDAKATVLHYAQTTPEQNTDPEKSPIEKPGESPDLPTDSARTQMDSDRHHHLHHHHEDSSSSSFKQHNDSFDDNMSLYADIGSEDRRGSTSIGDGDLDDTLDSSSPIEGSMGSGGDLDPLARLQHALQRSGMITMSDQDDMSSDPQKQQVFQCHLCSYTGTSRFHFNAHLNTHYDHKCTKCEFTTRTEAKLHEHLNVEHGINLDAIEDTDGIRVPRVNAQGKVKTFKCKQCGYVAITKSDFWEHARTHIKSEKLLTCPKCPFVTEYKHHLEYHLRNHFGSKPFKCNKCNYSCVNKSMLNSHMKSHSNVYQYRCADCTYATKYCHSLKLHLRKYAHSPAMVLNPDGTPNPVPIIDVYGTRRGPKIKKDENGMPILPPHYQLQAQLLKAQMEAGKVPSSQQPAELPQQGPKGGQTPVPPPPTSQQSPLPYPYSMMGGHGYQTSSPILSRALERSPEEAPRGIEGREQLRELLLERERTTQMHRMSPEAKGAIKCTICDFATGSREAFAQHMMIHTASEKTEIPESHEAPRSKSPSVERSITPDRRQPSPPPALQVPPYAPLVCPTVSEAGPHQFSTLAAAHNLKEYLARAMNPFLYPQGVVHPALGLQHHLQRLGHPVFQRPEELKEEGPHFFQQHHPHQMHLQQQQQHHPHHHHQQQQQQQHQLHQMTHVSPRASPQLRSPRMKETPLGDADSALDLSKEQSTPPMSSSSQPQVRPQNSSPTPSPYNSSPPSSSPPRSETSTPPTKNRRKGRAFKLERIPLRLSESAEGESSGHEGDGRKEDEGSGAGSGAGPGAGPGAGSGLGPSASRPMDPRIPPLVPMDTNEPNSPRKQEEDEEDRNKMEVHQEWEYQCQYCDMAFKDVVMYTMHMGYHDYKNPFTCNMCGHQATDKVAFFLHIARSSHA
ncbi:zinc finger protein hunchback [Oratosquilla oratoria]|uniref:zinc finger protein hunchback n=1 Tax=Oratosquilla oratoria TaxID=337810 RepID=UPI003F775810